MIKTLPLGRPTTPARPWVDRATWNDGDWMRYYISRLGLTRAEIATQLSCNERTIRRWCSQAKVPGSVLIALKSMAGET
jgi:hypothetical protein